MTARQAKVSWTSRCKSGRGYNWVVDGDIAQYFDTLDGLVFETFCGSGCGNLLARNCGGAGEATPRLYPDTYHLTHPPQK